MSESSWRLFNPTGPRSDPCCELGLPGLDTGTQPIHGVRFGMMQDVQRQQTPPLVVQGWFFLDEGKRSAPTRAELN